MVVPPSALDRLPTWLGFAWCRPSPPQHNPVRHRHLVVGEGKAGHHYHSTNPDSLLTNLGTSPAIARILPLPLRLVCVSYLTQTTFCLCWVCSCICSLFFRRSRSLIVTLRARTLSPLSLRTGSVLLCFALLCFARRPRHSRVSVLRFLGSVFLSPTERACHPEMTT